MLHANPESFIAYAPRAGLLCALVYLARGDDVCGWWIGRDAGAEYRTAYFLIENYYTPREGAFFTTVDGDLYGGWRIDYHAVPPALPRPVAVDDALAHTLEQLQSAFTREWLVFADDTDAPAQAAGYAQAELAMGAVAVRHNRLARLDRTQPVWRHFSHGLDHQVLARLSRDWPLCYHAPD